ncbi:SCP2 sterol-binding domain-containing protein [Frigidibacter sp. MR17.24]|uniref:SCP2 sterol-binding domain-containing protein n=1 Tax=Frigidibacter sp. MR17.24 TaxID=3127345 RepID=UPI0030130C04
MSDVVIKAVEKLNERLADGFAGLARVVITDEGSIMIDAQGARPEPAGSEGEADVTLIASAETFVGMLKGEVNPMSAYMTGKLKVEGDMSQAMSLGTALA